MLGEVYDEIARVSVSSLGGMAGGLTPGGVQPCIITIIIITSKIQEYFYSEVRKN